ncbi:condensation domain-containing protein [Dactylosporangium sp. NPDC050588]|uniref:condensation domain-containing protein n=1 Tax=Dactylosporangium sp. NPDC050588 TaxID=3157211 RepID=UPI0033FC52B5
MSTADLHRNVGTALSPAQRGIWFTEQLGAADGTFHVPVALRIAGPLLLESLRHAVEELVRHHDALRVRLRTVAGEPFQSVLDHATVPFAVRNAPSEEIARQLLSAEAKLPFDLQIEAPLRVLVIHLAPDQHYVLLTAHHLVLDGWSVDVLLDDMVTLYCAHAEGRTAVLCRRRPETDPLPADWN